MLCVEPRVRATMRLPMYSSHEYAPLRRFYGVPGTIHSLWEVLGKWRFQHRRRRVWSGNPANRALFSSSPIYQPFSREISSSICCFFRIQDTVDTLQFLTGTPEYIGLLYVLLIMSWYHLVRTGTWYKLIPMRFFRKIGPKLGRFSDETSVDTYLKISSRIFFIRKWQHRYKFEQSPWRKEQAY